MKLQIDVFEKLDPVSPDKPLWRYISLSSLFYMLLRNRSFVPKLALLRKDDVNEGKVPSQGDPDSWLHHAHLVNKDNFSWLRNRAHPMIQKSIDAAEGNPRYRQSEFEQLWLDQLATRRCVWCWHQGNIESMAFWKNYAHQGVAIRSDAISVLSQLDAVNQVVYGKIRYVDRRDSAAFSDLPSCVKSMPYFVKQHCYWHESEVRFVFRDDYDGPGRRIKVRSTELIKEIRISPYVEKAEAFATREIIQRLLNNDAIDVVVSSERDREAFPQAEEGFSEGLLNHESMSVPYLEDDIPPCLREISDLCEAKRQGQNTPIDRAE